MTDSHSLKPWFYNFGLFDNKNGCNMVHIDYDVCVTFMSWKEANPGRQTLQMYWTLPGKLSANWCKSIERASQENNETDESVSVAVDGASHRIFFTNGDKQVPTEVLSNWSADNNSRGFELCNAVLYLVYIILFLWTLKHIESIYMYTCILQLLEQEMLHVKHLYTH